MKPELLAPAGNMDKAIAAIEAGADALYLGFKQLSARKGAENFSIDEYQLILGYAQSKGIKVYSAINTVLAETELRQAAEYAKYIELLGGDAVIIQDLGLLHYLRQNHPQLSIHASTQMAVHNYHGVLFAKEMGIKRVVLSRECTLKEINALQKDFPDMEFEVFIHGAQCYGFSGLCHASGRLLNRSGNKGACGQICRTYMQNGKEKGYYFSAMDMMQESLPEQLHTVHSLKIEGRMKSPDYVFNTVAYYRDLIDKGSSSPLKKESMSISFSRSHNTGYMYSENPKDQVDSQFAGHKGVNAGTLISSIKKGKSIILRVQLKHDISVRDGVLLLAPQKMAAHQTTQHGAVKKIFFKGNMISSAKKGMQVEIDADISQAPAANADLYITSRHDKHIKTKGIPGRLTCRIPISLNISSNSQNMLEISVCQPAQLQLALSVPVSDFNQTTKYERVDSLFKKSSHPLFSVMEVKIDHAAAYPELALLKEAKNQLYAQLDDLLSNYLSQHPEKKQLHTFFTPEYKSPMPFSFPPYTESDILLPPVCFNSMQMEENLNTAPEKSSIRLTNPGQLMFSRNKKLSKLSFKADYGIYTNNSWASDFIRSEFPNVTAVCRYNEKAVELPIFIHRGDAGVPERLSQKSGSSRIEFETSVKDGISYTFIRS